MQNKVFYPGECFLVLNGGFLSCSLVNIYYYTTSTTRACWKISLMEATKYYSFFIINDLVINIYMFHTQIYY